MKFDVIKSKSIEDREELPEYFLADSPSEAERLYKDFEVTLNGFAYSYSISTGIDRSDLFIEALIALAKAAKDYDEARSKNFRMYAIFRIKDTLIQYTRKNSVVVSIPAYIKLANNNINKIKDILKKTDDLDFEDYIMFANLESTSLSDNDKKQCEEALRNLVAGAERARVNFNKFISRAEHIPIKIEYEEDDIQNGDYAREMEKLDAALIVNSLKKKLDDVELSIANSIMEGKNLKQIAEEHNKTYSWVSQKVKSFRKRL